MPRKIRTVASVLILYLIFLACLLNESVWAESMEDYQDVDTSQIASSDETAEAEAVKKYGMVPIYGRDIEDGEYIVPVKSSSSFFRIEEGVLTVKDGKLTLKMKLTSSSYLFVYPGTPEEASKASKSEMFFVGEQNPSFTFDIDALNDPFQCASFSKNREKWYGRSLLVDATDLPENALKITIPDYDKIEKAVRAYDKENKEAEGFAETENSLPEAVSVDMPDGEYSIEVNMTGGSGRASLSSPTWMKVEDGKAYVKLLWSSPYYDYMILEGKEYLNETEDGGNSTFTIPITAFDTSIPVVADTLAMGEPVAIDYILIFYEDSIGDKGMVPQEATKKVLLIALIIIVIGAIINFFVQKRRG